MELNERERREKIVHKYNENPNASFSFIANSLKLPRTTVSSVIRRCNDTLTIDKAPKPGRMKDPADKNNSIKTIRVMKRNPGLSDGDRGKNKQLLERMYEKFKLELD